MKACVLNWRGQTNQFIRMLVECLTCKATGNQAAKGFEVLSRDETQAMTKDSNAVIKLMYKQRFSQLVLPLLVDAYNNKSEDDVKAYLITAISCTLKVMPKQLLQLHLKEVKYRFCSLFSYIFGTFYKIKFTNLVEIILLYLAHFDPSGRKNFCIYNIYL